MGLIREKLEEIKGIGLSPLDLLPQHDLREKIVDLVLRGVPANAHSAAKSHLLGFRHELLARSVEDARVVVFGGGTGLSNIIGGDSRLASWKQKPFSGLKEIFPKTHSIVCVTDNGGSTGELLKDLPLVAIGDLRHVLLSSIQLSNLQKKYNINTNEAGEIVSILYDVFNWRFKGPLNKQHSGFVSIESYISHLPRPLERYFKFLFDSLFADSRFAATLTRSHCFGNLLLAAVIYREVDPELTNVELALNQELLHVALKSGINALEKVLGATEGAVFPCSSTPAQLRVLYTNGVEITGEQQLSVSRRGVPVDSVQVEYCDTIRIYEDVLQNINEADIIVFAPGSLYSSIIPVFKVPGLADAVRNNNHALKVLVSNLWVQAGETDLSIADPERKFHVSDMIRAYEKNIPGGTRGLFNEVVCISLDDIPASILQSYAVEGKIPIYLDRDVISEQGYMPIECGVYSRSALEERGVIQHDPETLALAIKGLYNGRNCFRDLHAQLTPQQGSIAIRCEPEEGKFLQPFQRFVGIEERLGRLEIDYVGKEHQKDRNWLKKNIAQIVWDHPVIPLSHLDYFEGVQCVNREFWNRDQQWDNVFSFFDPEDKCIKIRGDQVVIRQKLEVALLIALGESLLGDYADKKLMKEVEVDNLLLGRVYHLYLQEQEKRNCYLDHEQLHTFLALARMCPTDDENHYTRLVNKGESFTPPGLLMGLMYAWYIDNRLATHIEYKMSVMKINQTDLIPEQLKMADRRQKMIEFFKEVVFRQQA